MAKFEMQLPTEIIKDFEKIYKNSDEIFGKMTKAGAEVAYKSVIANVPASFRKSNIMKCLKLSRTYKTPSDGGINTKVLFSGYFKNHKGKEVPAPLVANVFEYGSSKVTKKPFMRKSFNKSKIEKAMLDEQKRASGGLLDE